MKTNASHQERLIGKDLTKIDTESLVKRKNELTGKRLKKWYLANIVVYRIERKNNKIINKKYCVFWDNLVLIKAKNHFLAYKKAFKYGKNEEDKHNDRNGILVEWKFAGVRDLVEVFGPIDDEYELTYGQGYKKKFSNIKKMIPKEEELGLFQYEKYYKKYKIHNDNYISKNRQRNL